MDAEELKIRVADLIKQTKISQLDKIMNWLKDRVLEYQQSGFNVLNTLNEQSSILRKGEEVKSTKCTCLNSGSTFLCDCGRTILAHVSLRASCYKENENFTNQFFNNFGDNESTFEDITERPPPMLRNKRRRMEMVLEEKFGKLPSVISKSADYIRNCNGNRIDAYMVSRESTILNNVLIGKLAASNGLNKVGTTEFEFNHETSENYYAESTEGEKHLYEVQNSINDDNSDRSPPLSTGCYVNPSDNGQYINNVSPYASTVPRTKARKSKYLSSYLPAWESEFNQVICWLQRSIQEGHAFCLICNREILIKHMGKSAILQHMKGRLHRNRFEQITNNCNWLSKTTAGSEEGQHTDDTENSELIDLSLSSKILKDSTTSNINGGGGNVETEIQPVKTETE
ncbi:hypothetical protein GJ496_006794 [Pomphorhynchus laevis]|nr:hypothetical protein GJ496_006794 [Pomphorhynchus laevis]